jgi:anti-sigma regulatory factor (Ser/Thr protein kinase)
VRIEPSEATRPSLVTGGVETMGIEVGRDGGMVLTLTPPTRCSLRVREGLGPSRMAALRHTAHWFLHREGVAEDCIRDVVLSVHEAAVNALEHGDGQVEVEIVVRPGAVTATVRDGGAGLDPALLDAPCPGLAERGRGLYLVAHLMDEVAVTDGPHPGLRMVRAI